jgi:hypothetical protein
MKSTTGFWSLAGLVVAGWIVADLLKSKNTVPAFNSLTTLAKNTGNQVTGG